MLPRCRLGSCRLSSALAPLLGAGRLRCSLAVGSLSLFARLRVALAALLGAGAPAILTRGRLAVQTFRRAGVDRAGFVRRHAVSGRGRRRDSGGLAAGGSGGEALRAAAVRRWAGGALPAGGGAPCRRRPRVASDDPPPPP